MSRGATKLVAMGDRAVAFTWGPAARVDHVELLAALRALPGVLDVVLAETSGAVLRSDDADVGDGAFDDALEAAVATCTVGVESKPDAAPAIATPRIVRIPVRYDGADLLEIATRLGASPDDVVAMHTSREVVATMVGFMPGFAYLRGVDPRLVVARRESPRPRIPARSVAIAAGYTSIYPFAGPGGWHLLGTTRFVPFDDQGARIALGDRVRFVEARDEDPSLSETCPSRTETMTTSGVALEVTRVQGAALIVDAGRFGRMHEGVPHGGPLVPRAFASAQARAGNAAGHGAIELYGSLTVTARGGSIVVATDIDAARSLRDGESFTLATGPSARTRYLAARGGFDVPVVLGSRTTLLSAAIGGYRGRILARGDVLAIGGDAVPVVTAWDDEDVPLEADVPIPIVLGPDGAPAETIAGILGATFRVGASSNRTGTRLDGPPISLPESDATGARASTAMVRGAIELTPSGLIVLGPDHPTTGGYPVPAVVRAHAVGALFSRPVGSAVRFVI